MGNFVSKHPYLTFFLGLFAISGVVAIAESASGTGRVGGAPKGSALPPKPVAVPR